MLFADELKRRLVQDTGLTEAAIDTAWPSWWTDEAEASSSAKNELRFSLARKLGLDPGSLASEQTPRFLWDGSQAKYKDFKGNTHGERPAITSFGASVGRILTSATPQDHQSLLNSTSSKELRSSILAQAPFVGLLELITLAWGIGIPVIHLRAYPLSAKRMCAMAVNVGGRHAILLARDAQYPAPLAFHLAHELGHIALGHLHNSQALVDMGDFSENAANSDPEELEADRFALELLTGDPALKVISQGAGNSARQLASECLRLSKLLAIEPGTLALCFGHSTNNWPVAIRSLDHIYTEKRDAWQVINHIAIGQINWDLLGDDASSFLRAVMGGIR